MIYWPIHLGSLVYAVGSPNSEEVSQMQCSACGTQLPEGVAYCPTCGSITPYHVSSSGVAPSDATIASSSQPSQYSYTPPDPYTPPNPYATPSLIPTPPPPPPPPAQQRRLSATTIALLIILVLVIIGAGGVLYFRPGSTVSQTQPHASPTTQTQQVSASPSPTTQTQQVSASSSPTGQAQQATATPSTQTPQGLYSQITQATPVLDDPLRMNGTNNWTESSTADGGCAFTGGAYHAVAQQQNAYMLCMAQATNFSDLAYQVQMTITKGEFGGIVFRTDNSQSKYYSFFIDRSGTYTLMTSVDDTGAHDYTLHKGTSASIKTGLNQANLLTIVARGSSIYVYINQQYITSAKDSTYRAGQIGVFGGNYTQAPADVVFSHIQVWKV